MVFRQNRDITFANKQASAGTTGRRLNYAQQLTDGTHPLTARVYVNRIWMHHMGQGIVTTPGDFGLGGAAPTHPVAPAGCAGARLHGRGSARARAPWLTPCPHAGTRSTTAARTRSPPQPTRPSSRRSSPRRSRGNRRETRRENRRDLTRRDAVAEIQPRCTAGIPPRRHARRRR